MLGVALLFLPELRAAFHNPTIAHGAVLALAATYVASLGNMAASRNTQTGLPVVTVNAYGMAYGAVGLAVIAALRGTPVAFDPRLALRAVTSLSLARRHFARVRALPVPSSSALVPRVPRTRAFCFRLSALIISTLFEQLRGGACPQSWGSRCW